MKRLCECGCGRPVLINGKTGLLNRFIYGHHAKVTLKKEWDDYPPPVVDTETGCLRWQGPHHSQGYGLCGKKFAHRAAWESINGPVPEGMELDHVYDRGCRHRDCVNVSHLEPVTHLENLLRGPGPRRTHCPQNHPYAGSNLIVRRGKRECRECVRARNRRNKRKRTADKTGW